MLIKNCRLALCGSDKLLKQDILLESGKLILAGQKSLYKGRILDAEGLIVLPGVIDAHVHFNTPGFEEREDFYHGSSFAASGGVTTVIDMPCTSVPPVTSYNNFLNKLESVKKQSVIDYSFYGGVSGSDFSELESRMRDLAPWVKGFKCYLISGMQSFGAVSYEQLEQVLRISKKLKKPVLLHTEDRDYILSKEKEQRLDGPREFYLSRPEAAETRAVARAARIAQSCGADLHIVHMSTAEGVRTAVQYGVSVETCPHYLEYDLSDFLVRGSILKVAPVIKSGQKELLWQYLREGLISFVTSDHAASRKGDKQTGSIWTDYAGITGTGLLLPYLLSEGYYKGRISMKRLLEICCENPAKRFGLDTRKGKIATGMDADLVLIDPDQDYEVRSANFLSKGKQSPLEGRILKGRIMKTIVRGQIVYDANQGILAWPGYGTFIN